jgi:hypothetical protein
MMSSKHYSNGLGILLSTIYLATTTRKELDEKIIKAIREATPAQIAEWLKVYQSWRRGESPYDYGLVPCPDPFTPYELGEIIDRAIELLKRKSEEMKCLKTNKGE